MTDEDGGLLIQGYGLVPGKRNGGRGFTDLDIAAHRNILRSLLEGNSKIVLLLDVDLPS